MENKNNIRFAILFSLILILLLIPLGSSFREANIVDNKIVKVEFTYGLNETTNETYYISERNITLIDLMLRQSSPPNITETNISMMAIFTPLPEAYLDEWRTINRVQDVQYSEDGKMTRVFFDRILTFTQKLLYSARATLITRKVEIHKAMNIWAGFRTPDICSRVNQSTHYGLYWNETKGGFDSIHEDPLCG